MSNSIFIYIGEKDNEIYNEMAMAVPNEKPIGTTILGTNMESDSKEIALQISAKLKKQVYISCNILSDNLLKPLIIKALAAEIKQCPHAF